MRMSKAFDYYENIQNYTDRQTDRGRVTESHFRKQ